MQKQYIAYLFSHLHLVVDLIIAHLLSVLHCNLEVSHLVLDNHLVRLRAQNSLLVCRILEEAWKTTAEILAPQEFDINPRVTLVGKKACH